MPELPEVQAHIERLAASHSGAVLDRFEALTFTALKTFDPRPEAVAGADLERIWRRGKYVVLDFGAHSFVVHLMQGGRLVPDKGKAKRPKAGVARWHFTQHPPLLLNEYGTERKAGVWVVAGDPAQQEPLTGLGPEAEGLDAVDLEALLADHPMRLHTFLRDQHILAGIGRRLANEVCHRARLSPFAATARLGPDGALQVIKAIRAAIADSLAFERTQVVMVKSAERPAAVHGRTGQACPVCGDTVREVAYVRYTVHYCPTCQTGGRILADNTTSKFLK